MALHKQDPPPPSLPFSPGLDGAAFSSRMPANRVTQCEGEFFPDVAHGSQSATMEFLFIRNKLLQTWLADPLTELTAEKAQNTVLLPQSGKWMSCLRYSCWAVEVDGFFPVGKANLVLRIHGYLQRYGYINYGLFNRVNPMHGESLQLPNDSFTKTFPRPPLLQARCHLRW